MVEAIGLPFRLHRQHRPVQDTRRQTSTVRPIRFADRPPPHRKSRRQLRVVVRRRLRLANWAVALFQTSHVESCRDTARRRRPNRAQLLQRRLIGNAASSSSASSGEHQAPARFRSCSRRRSSPTKSASAHFEFRLFGLMPAWETAALSSKAGRLSWGTDQGGSLESASRRTNAQGPGGFRHWRAEREATSSRNNDSISEQPHDEIS